MKQEFDSVIQQHSGINGAYVVPPFDVEEVFKAKRAETRADRIEKAIDKLAEGKKLK